jgi:hypothetical protein
MRPESTESPKLDTSGGNTCRRATVTREGFRVTRKKWRLVVTPLSGTTPLHQLDVEAPNWMGALRAARRDLGEDGGLPTGASCAVASDGTVTILDSERRRKFLLSPRPLSSPIPQARPSIAAPPAAGQGKGSNDRQRRIQTISYDAIQAPPRPARELELLFTRDEEPTPDNPLTYRERAYLIPKSLSVSEAEAYLRHELAGLQRQLNEVARGKLINLAAFDHRWIDQPERPPLVVLEWRDWRGEPIADYPAAERDETLERRMHEPDDRLASVFEALHELAQLRTPAEGLEFIVNLLETTVPSAAVSACLYDINTDELRFVALTGPGAETRRGTAVKRSQGLFGLAARAEHTALVIRDVTQEPAYDPAIDGRPGLDTRSVLVRQVVHDGRLMGMLQLINRNNGAFSAPDVHLVNYTADRLAEFLRDARLRARA